VSEKFENLAIRLDSRRTVLEKISEDFANVKRQINVGGLEGSFARILLERRRALPRPLDERQLLRKIRQELTETQRSLYFLEYESPDGSGDGVEDVSSKKVEEGQASKIPEGEVSKLNSTVDSLQSDLIAGYRRLIRDLSELDLVERQINRESARYRDFLYEQLFWERSSPVIGGETFRAISPGIVSSFGPERVREFLGRLSEIPMGFIVGLAAVSGFLIGMRGRFKAGLVDSGNRTRRVSTDDYLNTVRAFALTILLALPLPLALMTFGMVLKVQGAATDWSFGIGTAFLMIGAFMFVVQFAKEIAVEKGLGEYHFKWGKRNLNRVRLLFRRLVPIYIPSSLILCLIVGESSPEHIDGLGRLVALLTVIGCGTVFIFFAKPDPADENHLENPNYPFLKKGRGIYWFSICVVAGLILLLLVGFVVTTMILIVELQISVLVVYGALVFHGMVLRWFEIKERRMVLTRMISERRERQEAAEENDENEQSQSEEMLVAEAEKDQGLSLVEVGEQMRNVIRFLVGVGLIAVLYYLWAKQTPLLSGLATMNVFGSFSIADLALTLLVVGLTVSVTRNLPGLLEILVFRLLDAVPGTKTAITTLVQYAVITVGLVTVSRQLNIDWSHLGWIAAALSVGLGFGLQEVVANFVCGIILLFERPIRVGDVVTVGGVSGVVSKIQMRATTIVNWDQEELVVPNKEFITGSLLNMTLSNPINRVVISVGVAYGSDTERVLQILSQIASETEGVMDDPAPMITFEGFGDSSLNFSIRAYLPNRDNRLGVITELNRKVHSRFAEAGIEIPFPQRDLHVRSVDEGIRFPAKP
jgi:potassium efflux system protein